MSSVVAMGMYWEIFSCEWDFGVHTAFWLDLQSHTRRDIRRIAKSIYTHLSNSSFIPMFQTSNCHCTCHTYIDRDWEIPKKNAVHKVFGNVVSFTYVWFWYCNAKFREYGSWFHNLYMKRLIVPRIHAVCHAMHTRLEQSFFLVSFVLLSISKIPHRPFIEILLVV